MNRPRRLLVPFLLLPLLTLACLAVGDAHVGVENIWCALAGNDDGTTATYIVRHVRLPQMLTALIAGSALGAAGLVMQTVFANPLADPSLLGINAGASIGVGVSTLFLGGQIAVGSLSLGGTLLTVLSALAGAAVVMAILLLLAATMKSPLHLLVAGVMVSFAAGSLTAIISFFASEDGLRSYVTWGMGDFSSLSLDRLPLFALVVLCALALLPFRTRALDAFLLGSVYARNLGVNVRRERCAVLMVACLLCAIVTAVCGPIAFIGMAAPHAARFINGAAAHRWLLPLTLLWGANIALLSTILSHAVPGTIFPVNALTPILGVPLVFLLLSRRNA